MDIRVVAAAVAAILLAATGTGFCAAPKTLTAAPQFAVFAGHWNCVATHRERSYVVLGGEMFDRAFQNDGNDPLEQFRIGPDAGGFSEFSSDGEGTGAFREDGALVMTGEAGTHHTPVTITTRVDGDVLTRQVAKDGTASFEMCNREIAPPAPAACAQPNRAATVLTAAIARTPASQIPGTVRVRLVLDDRSNVIWSNVSQSDSVTLDASAVEATHRSTFRTEIVNCVPVPAAYIFTVEFRS